LINLGPFLNPGLQNRPYCRDEKDCRFTLVKYVIDSHGHDDHWLGNNFYKEEFNATIVGPESINSDYKDGDKTRMYAILPENAIDGTHIIKVDKVVKEPEVLKFGGAEFHLTPL